MAVVRSLHIYPVKSCQGIQVQEARLERWGLQYDRRWAVVSDSEDDPGHVENQYELQIRLAAIKTAIRGNLLVLSAEGVPNELEVEIRSVPDPSRRREIGDVQRTRLSHAEDEGEAASNWLTAFLARGPFDGSSFHLVWCPPDSQRVLEQDPKYGALYAGTHEATAFADTAQLHIASQGSLQMLNQELRARGGQPVPMSRFRPNLVVDGLDAWDEDTWRCVSVGPVPLRVCMPDIRCRVTTILQDGPTAGTRDKGQEPLKTLGEIRSTKFNGGCSFGIKLNQLVTGGQEIVRVGDEFNVLERIQGNSLQELDQDATARELLRSPKDPKLQVLWPGGVPGLSKL